MKKTMCIIYAFCAMAMVLAIGPSSLHAEQRRMKAERVVIMSFNILHGGTRRGQPLSKTVELIQKAQADIVGLQEAGDSASKLAKLLGWNVIRQGKSPVILTRYEIAEPRDGGVILKLDSGREICIFNLHLPPSPYQPYQLLRIPYGNAPFIDSEREAIASAKKTRGAQIAALLKHIRTLPNQDMPVFVIGDFNEPSHLDWTEKAARSGRHPIKVKYPSSLAMAKAGFTDAWRSIHPDEIKKPGFTWTPVTKADDPNDHHDRIDYVYFRGKGIRLNDVKIAGENDENADIVVSPYPSDHRAVIATFTLLN